MAKEEIKDKVELLDDEPLASVEESEPPRARLAGLMRKMLDRRDAVRSTQKKLRDIEMELRQSDTEKRSRFERMREAALEEYRSARADFARARMQLHNNLRMLPSRS